MLGTPSGEPEAGRASSGSSALARGAAASGPCPSPLVSSPWQGHLLVVEKGASIAPAHRHRKPAPRRHNRDPCTRPTTPRSPTRSPSPTSEIGGCGGGAGQAGGDRRRRGLHPPRGRGLHPQPRPVLAGGHGLQLDRQARLERPPVARLGRWRGVAHRRGLRRDGDRLLRARAGAQINQGHHLGLLGGYHGRGLRRPRAHDGPAPRLRARGHGCGSPPARSSSPAALPNYRARQGLEVFRVEERP